MTHRRSEDVTLSGYPSPEPPYGTIHLAYLRAAQVTGSLPTAISHFPSSFISEATSKQLTVLTAVNQDSKYLLC
jgi:hypothetical protein